MTFYDTWQQYDVGDVVKVTDTHINLSNNIEKTEYKYLIGVIERVDKEYFSYYIIICGYGNKPTWFYHESISGWLYKAERNERT